MFKLIIVEDEPFMNQYIVDTFLEWDEKDMELCGVFFNGEKAYEFLKENEVNLVITDIQMPKMDGLTLISKVTEKYPDMKFIVLSNFDDFYMVKEAFKLGATEYILKSDFKSDEFREMLIGMREKATSNLRTDKLSMLVHELAVKQFFWNGVALEDDMKKMRFSLEETLNVVVLKILNFDEVLNNRWDTQKELLKYGLANLVEEILASFKYGEFFFNNYNEIVFIFSGRNFQSIHTKIKDIFEQIIQILGTKFEMIVSCGVYDCDEKISLKEQFNLAKQAIDYSFFEGRNKIILYSAVKDYKDTVDKKKIFAQIEKTINGFDFENLNMLLEKLCGKKLDHKYLVDATEAYKRVISTFSEIYSDYEIDSTGHKLLEINLSYQTALEINELVAEAGQFVLQKLAHADILITQVQNYIRKNYSQNITLQFLSKQFLYDYTELSRRFQKATGTTFPKFLNDVRLSEAVKLIKTTDLKFTQISERVGYNSYESFCRAFKDKFNKTANEIRREGKL